MAEIAATAWLKNCGQKARVTHTCISEIASGFVDPPSRGQNEGARKDHFGACARKSLPKRWLLERQRNLVTALLSQDAQIDRKRMLLPGDVSSPTRLLERLAREVFRFVPPSEPR